MGIAKKSISQYGITYRDTYLCFMKILIALVWEGEVSSSLFLTIKHVWIIAVTVKWIIIKNLHNSTQKLSRCWCWRSVFHLDFGKGSRMVPTQNVPEIRSTPATGHWIRQMHDCVIIQVEVPWSFYQSEMVQYCSLSVCVDNNNKFIGCRHIWFLN